MLKRNNLNDIYCYLANKLINDGRYCKGTLELNNVLFKLTDIEECFINVEGKKISQAYLLAENIWYASGNNETKFIGKFAKKWLQISDDGIHANSAYGYIIQKKFGFNQINKIIELLRIDSDTRRACIIINDANKDIIETKDEQCTMYLQFFIRNNKLELTVNMRSNDIIYGLPYDVPAFIAIQKYIASKLNIQCGSYTHFAGSLHCYQKDMVKLGNISSGYTYNRTYKVDFVKLYNNADKLFDLVNENPEYIIDICMEADILCAL